MKKIASSLCLLGLVLLACGFSLKDWRASLYDSVKQQAESSFSALLNRKIAIESAGGPLIGQIDLNNFAAPGLGRAERVVLTYNPITYALAKGDMVPALIKITVINGSFTVERDRKGGFPILSFLSSGGGAGGPPPFHGRVILKDCRANYIDQRGFKETPSSFAVNAEKLNGALDLRKKNIIKYSVSGRVPEIVKAQGLFDLSTNKYELNVSAENLDLKKWGNYTLPLPGLKAAGGVVDLNLRLTPPKTPGWPVALVGRAKLFGGSGEFQTVKVLGLAGEIFFDDEKLALNNLSGRLNDFPVTANGRLDQRVLTINFAGHQLLGGDASGRLNLDFKLKPRLKLSAKFSKIDLFSLSQNSSGLEGRADGWLALAGPLDNLAGRASAALAGGSVFGQPIKTAAAAFRINEGNYFLDEFTASAGSAFFRAGGTVAKDLTCDLQAEAGDFHLAGQSLLGPVSATLTRFKGRTRFRLNQAFLASPLKHLAASGEVSLSDGLIGEQPFAEARGHLAIDPKRVDVSFEAHELTSAATLELRLAGELSPETKIKASLNMPETRLDLAFEQNKEDNIKGLLQGTTNLDRLTTLTKPYDRLSGRAGFAVRFGGTPDRPLASASFWLRKFGFGEIAFDEISGALAYAGNNISLIEPLTFKDGSDTYTLIGDLNFKPKLEESLIGLELEVKEAHLAAFYRLVNHFRAEIFKLFGQAQAKRPAISRLDLAALKLPAAAAFSQGDQFQLYRHDGKAKYFLADWQAVKQQARKIEAAAPEETLGGTLKAKAGLSGQIKNLSARLEGQISRGFFRQFNFDFFDGQAVWQNQKFKIEKALLAKSGGSLSARGDYSPGGELVLNLNANNLPLDILALAFPGKEFKGVFNLNAELDGPLENLHLAMAAASRNLRLAGANFDEAALSLTKIDDSFYLHELSLLQGRKLSRAYGSLNFARPGKIDLEANLKDGALGLINLLTDQVKWLKGDATISLKASGTLAEPKINGRLAVKDGVIHLAALDSDLKKLAGAASIESNVLRIANLTGTWAGARTKDVENVVGVSGTIDLGQALAERSALNFNLAFSPARLYADFPNLFTGALNVGNLSLTGPLYFDGSDGPLLRGQVEVSNAVITLSPAGGGGRGAPLHLSLGAGLAKNVYAVMGDVATLNLSNILMNLEIAGDLGISGSLADPNLLGRIMIRRGSVNIFNREFSLLTDETRKKYTGAEIAPENTALFRGGLQPDVDITAGVEVDDQAADASGKPVKKKVNVLARLKGLMGAREEEQGLKVYLSAFTEDKTKTPAEFAPAAYNEQALKVLLLPDFIKSLAGLNQPGAAGTKVDTNAVVADYLTSRVESLLFRSLERQAEQQLGLESLTLEYNFGPKIREAIGVRDVPGFEQERPAWSIGFAKALFDRLYIDVRYAQASDQAATTTTANQTLFNYQLTYKLMPICSIIYYREPASISQPTTGYQKVTLKAGLSLW